MTSPQKKTIFSGIQPSGTLHIGNYLGAIKQWVRLAADNTGYFCIVDEHAITVPYEPKDMPERILNLAATYLAAGINPDQSIVFVQSHVAAHTELAWLLMTTTPFGELARMTQFKDKSKQLSKKNKAGLPAIASAESGATAGLFGYPVLMAADILLYQTRIVPVGEDQVQHIELARDIAQRFNNRFGEVFTIPEAKINNNTARIMSLSDPTKKMSKSDNTKSYIALTDSPDEIKIKIMSAVTETDPVFSFTKSGPAVKNLLTIYQAFSDEEPSAIEAKFNGKGYKEFKEALAQLVINQLSPLQQEYKKLRQSDDELRIMLGRGKHHAEQFANTTLRDVKEKMGLL
ncbi:MAG: tryptophan--tRNA ligase [Candidatus Andersenbacteria bacterium]|nr:tryptophan--tRNA ligase [bacterium]MDZ4225734.1 tryptophan--tRNA ligase [Candidatus Andersenbacteria bacterium]